MFCECSDWLPKGTVSRLIYRVLKWVWPGACYKLSLLSCSKIEKTPKVVKACTKKYQLKRQISEQKPKTSSEWQFWFLDIHKIKFHELWSSSIFVSCVSCPKYLVYFTLLNFIQFLCIFVGIGNILWKLGKTIFDNQPGHFAFKLAIIVTLQANIRHFIIVLGNSLLTKIDVSRVYRTPVLIKINIHLVRGLFF